MAERRRSALCAALVTALAAAVLLSALARPVPAVGASVVNGDFEAGGLQGWQVHREVGAGDWFAYAGDRTPISEKRGNHVVQPPPQGKRSAIADQLLPETLVLYQDVALEPNRSHFLNFFAYYDSAAAIAVASPETLTVDDAALAGRTNQQFRLEVVAPDAPIDTVDTAHILAEGFRTRPGDPRRMRPLGRSIDISGLAGRTVRIRAVVVAGEELLNAGVDAISITRAPEPPTLGAGGGGDGVRSGGGVSSRLRLGKAEVNRRSGAVELAVEVPSPGLVLVQSRPRWAIQRLARKAKSAGTVRLTLRPGRRAMALLRRRHALRAAPTIHFVPAAGESERASRPIVFRLHRRKKD